MIIIKVDIVGGGLAGLSTAIGIKKRNPLIHVTIYEKNKEIGYNLEGRRCGEAHSITSEWDKWIPEKKSYFNEITKGEFYFGDKKKAYSVPPNTGYMLNRQEFIAQLGREAKKLGTEIRTNEKIKSVEELDSNYIVDASGCPSKIKKSLGLKQKPAAIGYQQTIESSNSFLKDTLKIFYMNEFGYYWIFPRNPAKKEINLGIGVIGKFDFDLKKKLEEFKEKKKITGKINHVTGGLIPIGLQRPFKHDNILFVGDAGVGTFPLTGQGIYRALLSGDLAARSIVNERIKQYPHLVNFAFIKYDVLCKVFMKTCAVLKNIEPKIALGLTERFLSFSNRGTH